MLIGVESINRDSLNSINKGFNKVEQYGELIGRLKKAGIIPILSFVFRFDDDTPDIFKLTLEFIRKNKIAFTTFWMLTPLPGSKLFDEMKKAGRIDENDWSKFDANHLTFKPKNFTKGQYYDLFWETYQKVYTIKNIFKNIIHNVKSARNHKDELSRSLLFQPYYRTKVKSNEQPFSNGIWRIE